MSNDCETKRVDREEGVVSGGEEQQQEKQAVQGRMSRRGGTLQPAASKRVVLMEALEIPPAALCPIPDDRLS